MYPYDHPNQGEFHNLPRHPEEHQHRQQHYSEEHRYHYPEHYRPPYSDSADYDHGLPPPHYSPMPPQFGPPGHLPHSGSMGHPEPYAGSFYPSMYPPPYRSPYPPVSTVGPFNPPAYPPTYPPTQEYNRPSAHEYPPTSVPYPPSYPPIQDSCVPHCHPSLCNQPSSYPPTNEDIHHSVPERNPSLHNSSYHPTHENSHHSVPERNPSLRNSSYHPTNENTHHSVPERNPSLRNSSYPPIHEDTHLCVPERSPSLHNPHVHSSTHEDACTSILKPQQVSAPSARFSDAELPKGDLVRIFCKTNRSCNLAVQGNRIVMATANVQDDAQLWIKDGKCGVRIKDNYGHPAFMLINRASKKVLKHSNGKEQPVQLLDYSPDMEDEDVIWTESQDFGEGYKTVRMASDTLLNLTVLHGDASVRHGSSIVLDTWHKKDHQLWKIFPL